MSDTQNFYDKVLKIVRQIPKGKVTTYGIIAGYIGQKGSARMVGWVLNKQKHNTSIPAHRVVNRQGLLTGKMHFDGINLMHELLENEGVEVSQDKIVNLDQYLWYPENIDL